MGDGVEGVERTGGRISSERGGESGEGEESGGVGESADCAQ